MTRLLMSLEPRFETRGTILIDELDEVSEITFVTHGQCVIGFDFNKEKKMIVDGQGKG